MDFLVSSGRGFHFGSLAELATSAVNQVASQVERRIDRALDISEADNAAASRVMRTNESGFFGQLLRPVSSSPSISSEPEPYMGFDPDSIVTLSLPSSVEPAPSPVIAATAPTSVASTPEVASSPKIAAASPVVSNTSSTNIPMPQVPLTPVKAGASRSRGARGRGAAPRSTPGTPQPFTSEPQASPGMLIAEAPPPTISLDDSSLPGTPAAVHVCPDIDASVSTPTLPLDTAVSSPNAALERDAPEELLSLSTRSNEKAVPRSSDGDGAMERMTQQIISLTTENASLNDLVADLRMSLEEMSAQQANMGETTEEATEAKRAIELATRERDALRTELTKLRASVKSTAEEHARVLTEKEDQVKQLMEEGEKLAKEQHRNGTMIKKLRAQEKESETKMKELNAQAEENTRKLAAMQEELRLAERQKDAGIKAQQLSDTAAKRVAELEQLLHESKAKETSLQASLQKAWDEASELRKAAADTTVAVQSEALAAARGIQAELQERLIAQERTHETATAQFKKEIYELRTAMTRAEDQAAWRQDQLTQEVRTMQERLLLSESRATELAAATEDAARPLLRQIDALQAQALASNRNWQLVEESLAGQLRTAIDEKNIAVERERSLNNRVKDLTSRVSALEASLSSERNERARIAAELERAQAESQQLANAVEEEKSRADAMRDAGAKALVEAKDSHRRQLAQRIEEERISFDTQLRDEQNKVSSLQASLDKLMTGSNMNGTSAVKSARTTPVPVSTVSVSELLSPDGDLGDISAVDDASSSSAAAKAQSAIVERLNSLLHAKSNEIESLASEVKQLIASRDRLAAEALRANESALVAQKQAERVPAIEAAMAEVSLRFTAALELLGERTDEVEALRSDLEDVKAIFREQITELLDRIEAQKAAATTAQQAV